MLSKFVLNSTKKTQDVVTKSLSKRCWSFGKTYKTDEMYVEIDETKYIIWKNYVKIVKIMFPIVFGLQLLEDGIVYKELINKCINDGFYIPILKPSKLFENFVRTTFSSIGLTMVWPISLFGTLQQTIHLIDYFNGNDKKLQKRFPHSSLLYEAINWVDYDDVIERYRNTMSPFGIFPLMWALAEQARKENRY